MRHRSKAINHSKWSHLAVKEVSEVIVGSMVSDTTDIFKNEKRSFYGS